VFAAISRARECGVDAGKPPAAEAPEVRQRAVALPAGVGVGVERLIERTARDGAERQRPDLAVDVGADSLLQQTDGADDAVIDGRVEVKEGECRREIGASRRSPVARGIDRAHRRVGNAL